MLAGDMGQCLWEKQSSSEARAEASVTNVASLHADQCGHLEASRRCAYTVHTLQTNRQTDKEPGEMSKGQILMKRVTAVIGKIISCSLRLGAG